MSVVLLTEGERFESAEAIAEVCVIPELPWEQQARSYFPGLGPRVLEADWPPKLGRQDPSGGEPRGWEGQVAQGILPGPEEGCSACPIQLLVHLGQREWRMDELPAWKGK